MADTVGSGIQEQDTDYKYEDMVQGFIDRGKAAANALTQQMAVATGAITSQLIGLGQLNSIWLSGLTQVMPAITASAIDQINTSGATSQLMNLVFGGRLSNSANPSVPSNPNTLAGNQSSQGGQMIMLPSKSTITTP